MSREIMQAARPAAVWLTVTAAAVVAAGTAPTTWADAASSAGPARTVALIVATCATALALALVWLWVVTTATVADLLTGVPLRPRAGGATRRLVLVACGAAVVAGTAVPAQAGGGDGAEVLVGLRVPERAVAPVGARGPVPRAPAPALPAAAARRPAPGEHVVLPGESLWSIAVAHPAPGTDVDSRWRDIWAANRDLVGPDPDLIHPGQALRLPLPDDTDDTDDTTSEDGAR